MTKLAAFYPVETPASRGPRSPGEKKPHLDRPQLDREGPHRLEHAVQRQLLSHPKLRFATLVIRRIPNGVCLEGVLEDGGNLDICGLARNVAGVNEVLNHLVVRQG